MHYIGFCPHCEGGTLGIRVCAAGKHAVAMCDECDAVWTTPDLKEAPAFPKQPDLPCPLCQTTLCNPPAHWATKEEVSRTGWQSAIVGETEEDHAPTRKAGSKSNRKDPNRQ